MGTSDRPENVETLGCGTAVVLLQLFRRETRRHYEPILEALVQAGFQVIMPNPVGYSGDTEALRSCTYATLADQIAAAVGPKLNGPAHIVGAAMGGCVARCFARRHPAMTRSVTHISHGGGSAGSRQVVPTDADVRRRFRSIFFDALSETQRLAAIQHTAFSPHSGVKARPEDYEISPAAARELGQLPQRTPVSDWWNPRRPFLVIQGTNDRLAPPANARALAAELGNRIELVEIDNAGHMPVREQPDKVGAALLSFWRRVDHSLPAGLAMIASLGDVQG